MMQVNYISGKAYQGKNQITLDIMQRKNGYVKSEWLTFIQAKQVGLSIKKDSKGVAIIRIATFEKEEKITKRPVKKAVVFNLEQTEKIEKV